MNAVGKADKHPPPKIYSDCLYILEGFNALSSARIGFDSIKFSEIEAWLNLNGISNLERRQELTHLIRIMDIEFLKFMKDKYVKK